MITEKDIEKLAIDYAISRGADRDKKAFRSITNRDLYDHTVQCFEAGFKQASEMSEFKSFIEQTELSDNDKNLIKGVYYDFLNQPPKQR